MVRSMLDFCTNPLEGMNAWVGGFLILFEYHPKVQTNFGWLSQEVSLPAVTYYASIPTVELLKFKTVTL